MSVLNQSGEEQVECPLCMEPLEVDDLHFYPCTCGYQICRFCWNRIREGENGLCPACRKAYPENPADFTPLSQEQVAAIKTEKKAREQKKRNKTLESRRALANVRVVQNNLVFVVGLPVRLADPEILKRQEYFGKYGKIHKVVINQSTSYAGSQGPSASAYVTYVSPADALRAIQGVNNVTLDGRVLKGSLGTTKYCANFMKNQPCPKPDCMYLHELGDPKASFTKEEMHAGLHQVYERKLHNQLLQRDKPEDKQSPPSGNSSSTNAEKGSSNNNKDGNQSNFISTTVVTSSNINIVNSSSKSKKDSSSFGSASSGKEAWPSLGSSPPPSGKLHSFIHSNDKSQENVSSESSSPTNTPPQIPIVQVQSKNKETETKPSRNNKENSTNSHNGKKSKSDKKHKSSNSSTESNDSEPQIEESKIFNPTTTQSSVFENTDQNYLTNELDELESDRHSLLENHDLLDNSDHSLLDDDSAHNLLNDVNNEVLMMQRQREMLAGLVENNHLISHNKSPLVNGFGLLDRDAMSYLGNDRQINQISQGLVDQKELLLRERSRSEMIMRQNEMLGRHNVMVEPKHYMPTSSIGLDSASELLGANYHPNSNILPPFGMRVENSLSNNPLGASSMTSNHLTSNITGNHLSGNTMTGNVLAGNVMAQNALAQNAMAQNALAQNAMAQNALVQNALAQSAMTQNAMAQNALGGSNMAGNAISGFMLHNQQMMQNHQQMQQNAMVNGFDAPQNSSEGRYLAENMDKFFTDFHKAQQMRLQHNRNYLTPHLPRNVLSAERLEYHHKQRMNHREQSFGGRAAGDCDDDLDFDPFKETQKALAEMIETEMMQNNHNSSRLPPPGFSHMSNNTFGGVPRHPHQQHQGYNGTAMFSDWTQMDPAIMSTSVAPPQELVARFAQLGVKQSWGGVPLPPGFAPPKPNQHPAECIDAK